VTLRETKLTLKVLETDNFCRLKLLSVCVWIWCSEDRESVVWLCASTRRWSGVQQRRQNENPPVRRHVCYHDVQ